MDKYIVSELRHMCKDQGLKLSCKGKPFRKAELIQNLIDKKKLTDKKVSFADEDKWNVVEFDKNAESHYNPRERCKMIMDNRYKYSIEIKLCMEPGDFNDIFNHKDISNSLSKCKQVYRLQKENIKSDWVDRIILYSVSEELKKTLHHLTQWFIRNHSDIILNKIKN
tara:strand:- start:502 stop:1002 length:501 start_codon:yes stop_codon:yes gene_type:complete